MSKRTRNLERVKRSQSGNKRAKLLVASFFTFALFALIALMSSVTASKNSDTQSDILVPDHLSEMRNDQLEAISIEERNLLIGMDLQEEQQLAKGEMLKRLDEIIQRVKVETERNYHRFLANPSQYEKTA